MDKKTLLVGFSSLLLIGIVAVVVILFGKSNSLRGTSYTEPYPVAANFKLARDDGSSFQLSDARGNIVLLFFGYTSCPDVCPTTLAELNQAMKNLSEKEAEQVKVIFVTVDPDRDTPQKVQEYVNYFNPDFIGLSGTEETLSKVWSDYGVYREIADSESAAGYLVNHTARVTMIDRNGNLRVSYSFETPVADIVHDLKVMLKEGN